MQQTQGYSGSQYARDNGFPLTWICRCCCAGPAHSTIREEAEEYHERNKSRPGTIIGRVAGREAYIGKSAMQYQKQSHVQNGQAQDTADGWQLEAPNRK